MTSQQVVVVYCDGTTGSPHKAAPISVYRRTDEHDWHPIHSVLFRGEDVVLAASSLDQLRAETGAAPTRSQYRWRCTQPRCFDLMANDTEAIHRLFELYSTAGEVSLSRVDELQKAAAKHRRPRR